MKQVIQHGVLSLIVYLVIHAMLCTPAAQAAGTTLNNIREGLHTGYTRLVLDCQGAAPEVIGPTRRQFFGVRFANLAVRANLESISRRLRGRVRQVELLDAKAADEIRLLFQSPGLRVKTLIMKSDTAPDGRYRLVIDVFPKPADAIDKKPRAAAGAAVATPMPDPSPAIQISNRSTAVAGAAPKPVTTNVAKAVAADPESAAKDAEKAIETPSVTQLPGRDTSQWTYSGEAGMILSSADGEDESSKFEEYRDLSQPVTGNLAFEAERNRDLYVRGSAANVGRDDPSVNAAAGRYGRYDLDFRYDRLIHRYAYDARTLYSGVGSGVMTLDDTLQSNVQSAPTSEVSAQLLNDAMAVAAIGDPEVTRNKAKLSLRLTALEPFNFKIEVGHETREGTRPYAGAFSNTQMVELFEPIDYETTDFRITGEYNRKNILMNFAYHYSQFNNDIDTLTFDNPLRATDAAMGPSTGQIDLAPDNQYHNLSLTGAWTRLPGDSQIAANIALGWMLQDEDLVPFTTNTAISAPALTVKSADAKVNTSLCYLRLTSHPLPYMHVKANLRYYDYDNRTGRIDFTGGYVDTDASVISTPITNLPTSYTKTRAGLDLDFDVLTRTRLGVGYQFERTDRENREVDQQDDNTIKTFLDTRPFDWGNLRATYQRTDRQIGDYNADVYLLSGSDIGELPQMRKYDQADMVRDRYSVSATVYPLAAWTLTGTFTYGKDDFEDSPYGLLEDDHTITSIDTDYAINDRATVNLFYTYEKYENSQRGNDSGTDWMASGEDLINTVGGGATLALIPRRLDFNLTYSYSEADGDIAFTSPAGSFADFKAVDDAKIHMLNSKLRYHFSKHLALSLGYMWEKFDYKDYNTNGFAYVPTDAAGNYQGALLAGTLPKDYDAQIVYTQLTLRFK